MRDVRDHFQEFTMAHFYGTLSGSRGPASRMGTKNSGLTSQAAGWQGCIETTIWHNEKTGKDMFRVELKPWQNSGGNSRTLAEGELDAKAQA